MKVAVLPDQFPTWLECPAEVLWPTEGAAQILCALHCLLQAPDFIVWGGRRKTDSQPGTWVMSAKVPRVKGERIKGMCSWIMVACGFHLWLLSNEKPCLRVCPQVKSRVYFPPPTTHDIKNWDTNFILWTTDISMVPVNLFDTESIF